MNKLKVALIEKSKSFVDEKLATIIKIMSSNQKALLSETKSSAGDKHETGRAMLQLEMEKASLQLPPIKMMKETLNKVDLQARHEIVHLGSLVYTTAENYFLVISVGKLVIENDPYFVISPLSPIGSLLLGKREGDHFSFNNSTIEILKIY